MRFCKISLKPIERNAKYPEYTNAEFRKLFGSLKVNPQLAFTRQDLFEESPRLSQGMSLSGMQQKLSFTLNDQMDLVPTATKGDYILKPSPEEYPHAAENEHCAMVSSRLLGIETALCGLIAFQDGELVYLTKRFDRTPQGKLHQEDLAQGFNKNSASKYSESYESAGHLISQMTRGKIAVVRDFFYRVVHAYLIGNDDMHLKNICLLKLVENTGLFYDKLTPHYDCLFTHAFKNYSAQGVLALDLLKEEAEGLFSEAYEKAGYYTSADFRILGNRLGLRDQLLASFFRKVTQLETPLRQLIQHSYMPLDMKNRAESLVRERMKALNTP